MSLDWAFSNSGLEVWLPAFQLSMFDILAFCEIEVSSPYQKLEVPESGSTLYELCITVASCPSLRCSCRNKPVSCREAEGLVTELWSRGLVEEYSDLRWFHVTTVTTTKHWMVLEIELSSTVGGGAASLSAASVRKFWCTAERRFARHVCFRSPFLPFLWEMPSIHSLPEA